MWLVKQKQPFYHSFENLFEFPNFRELNSHSNKTTEVKETSDNIHISIALPGINKDDIQIEFIDEHVKVDSKSNAETKLTDENLAMQTLSSHYNLSHYYYIGDVDYKNSKASLKNGILSITFPKKEKQKPHLLKIS